MIKTRILAAVVALLSLVGFTACRPVPEPTRTATTGNTPVLRSRLDAVMGTQLKITVIGTDPSLLDRAMEAAAAEVKRVEDLMTDWRASELTSLNESSGEGPREVPRELAAIISRATELHRLTSGAFDITFAAAGKLWSFKTTPKSLPDPEKIKAALQLVNAGAVKVSAADKTVELPAGMKIGLGGIAKGYGVDRAMKILMDHGIRNALVDAGGDMKILGMEFDKSWKIAIKHPRRKEKALAVLNLANTCLVTSGDYERFFELEGKRYHHIIDPRTGYPARGCMSASVVAPNAEYADALATSMCVLGPEKGLELIERLPRIEAVLVDMNGKVHVSSGLRGQVPQGEGNEPASE
ncbi:MAG: FAD:protein FMN transferase [Planctomycetota bacterium]|nr:FAD:protein FMN transferase [Planctomycetota bacterium]